MMVSKGNHPQMALFVTELLYFMQISSVLGYGQNNLFGNFELANVFLFFDVG